MDMMLGRINTVVLDMPTNSQAETVYDAIQKTGIEGFIYIKDSDGYFECDIESDDNQVTYFDINNINEINAKSKS
jgi:hypothetical protein